MCIRDRLLGFPSTTVDDVIRERTAGTSKYTVRKMFSLALDGITSFSVKPIYMEGSEGMPGVFGEEEKHPRNGILFELLESPHPFHR